MSELVEMKVSMSVLQDVARSSSVPANISHLATDEVENDVILDINVVSSDPVKMDVQNIIFDHSNILAKKDRQNKKKSTQIMKLKSVEKKKLVKMESIEIKQAIESDKQKNKNLESEQTMNLESVYDKDSVEEKNNTTKTSKYHRTYTCPKCGVASGRASSFKKHLKSHPKFECDMCEYESTDVNEAFLHMNTHERPTDVSMIENQKEIRIGSTGTKPKKQAFGCVMCDYKKSNGEPDFNCNLCKSKSSFQAEGKYEKTTQPDDSISMNKNNIYGKKKFVELDQNNDDFFNMAKYAESEQCAKIQKIVNNEQDDEVIINIELENDEIANMEQVAEKERVSQNNQIVFKEDEEIEQEDEIVVVIIQAEEEVDNKEQVVELEQNSPMEQDSKLEQDQIPIDLNKNAEFEPPIWIEGTRNYCNQCEGEIWSKDVFIRHWWNHNMKKYHIKQDYPFEDMVMFKCKICGDKFEKLHFSRHIIQHDIFEKLKCNQCEYNTLFKVDLNQHILKIHSGSFATKCK